MAFTIKELINHLQTNYDPDEVVAYTLWSKGDVVPLLVENGREDIDADEVWREIVDDFENGMDSGETSMCLSELVDEQVALYEKPEEEG